MNNNIKLFTRRTFIRNVFAGSFGIAIATVLGCQDDSVDILNQQKPSENFNAQPKNTSPKKSMTTPLKQSSVNPTNEPNVIAPKEPVIITTSKPLESINSDVKKSIVESKKISREFKPRFAGTHYKGPLFDSHLHMPELIEDKNILNSSILNTDVSMEEIIDYLNKENVTESIAFSLPHPQKFQEYYAIANQLRDINILNLFVGYPGPHPQILESILSMSNGLYKGLGELGFYTYPLKGTPPDAPQMSALYNIIGKYKMIVMLHPDNGQSQNVRNMLKMHPDVNFLFHGNEICYDIDSIINEFDNAYFSIDSAVFFTTVYKFTNQRPRIKPMYGLFTSGPLENFISAIENQYYNILNDNIDFWKSKIEANPTKYLWGTDRFLPWHWSEEVSLLFEEFARAFIGGLPKSTQEMYAYINGKKLLNS